MGEADRLWRRGRRFGRPLKRALADIGDVGRAFFGKNTLDALGRESFFVDQDFDPVDKVEVLRSIEATPARPSHRANGPEHVFPMTQDMLSEAEFL